MKIRVKFRKYGVMKFIGHLDIMRYFQKAIKRADISISYTGGFSPHMIMSFASPLGVGITSDGEYLDIEVESALSSADGVRRLNEAMVDGMEVVSFRQIPEEKSQNAMSLVAAADYEVTFRAGKAPVCLDSTWQEEFLKFLSQPEIQILKKSKKSERELDIRPFIYDAAIDGDLVFLRLSAGSVTNIKPELVFEAFYQYLGLEFDEFALLVHRKELYAEKQKKGKRMFVSLEDLGTEF